PSPYPTHPQPAPALHLLAGLWVASCPVCGVQLTTARNPARCERPAARPGPPPAGRPVGPLPPGLRVPAHHRAPPGPLRPPRRPPPLPRLPRGRLMPRITIHLGGRGRRGA